MKWMDGMADGTDKLAKQPYKPHSKDVGNGARAPVYHLGTQ